MESSGIFTRYARVIFTVTILFTIIAFTTYLTVYRAPKQFPLGVILHVEKNSTLSEIATGLKDKNIIRSEILFKGFVVLMKGEKKLAEGDYFFRRPVGSWNVAKRIVNAEFGLTPIKITLPEGSNINEIAGLLHANLAEFSAPLFVKLAQGKEGYLFPDTYFFYPNARPETIIEELEENFNKKIEALGADITASKRTLNEIVTMASLVEKEANTTESRKMVADILWRRLDKGIPLQVDAPFVYILGKGSAELTLDDLKVDSPYNTYLYKGLPRGPITNPGLDAINATLNPTKNEYLYFLTDNDGEMRYAKDHDQHVLNKDKYLR